MQEASEDAQADDEDDYLIDTKSKFEESKTKISENIDAFKKQSSTSKVLEELRTFLNIQEFQTQVRQVLTLNRKQMEACRSLNYSHVVEMLKCMSRPVYGAIINSNLEDNIFSSDYVKESKLRLWEPVSIMSAKTA